MVKKVVKVKIKKSKTESPKSGRPVKIRLGLKDQGGTQAKGKK